VFSTRYQITNTRHGPRRVGEAETEVHVDGVSGGLCDRRRQDLDHPEEDGDLGNLAQGLSIELPLRGLPTVRCENGKTVDLHLSVLTTRRRHSWRMKKRNIIAAAFGAAAVLLGIGGALAAANPISTPAPQGPAVIIDQPGNGPDLPGVVDAPEPGDTPDGPGE
jgi:hypothetical protein